MKWNAKKAKDKTISRPIERIDMNLVISQRNTLAYQSTSPRNYAIGQKEVSIDLGGNKVAVFDVKHVFVEEVGNIKPLKRDGLSLINEFSIFDEKGEYFDDSIEIKPPIIGIKKVGSGPEGIYCKIRGCDEWQPIDFAVAQNWLFMVIKKQLA